MPLNEEVDRDSNGGMAEEYPLVIIRNEEQEPEKRQSAKEPNFDVTATMFESSDVAVRITVNLETPLKLGKALYRV